MASESRNVVVVSLDGRVVQELMLSPGVTTIGRLPGSALVLSHPSVSRRHAEISLQADGLVLTDLGSSEGTFVEGRRAAPHQPIILTGGLAFRIGPFTLTYSCGAPIGTKGERQTDPIDTTHAIDATQAAAPPIPVGPPRQYWPAPPPAGTVSRYLSDLPAPYQESEFLGRFLQVFESLWEPFEERQDHLPMYFDPRTCPAIFLPWIAGWLHVPFAAGWPEARRRRMLVEAFDLMRWRGTRYGLARLIELCTGATPSITEDACPPFVFRIRITLSPASDLHREQLEELVRAHKPAHAGYILEVRP